MNKSLGEQLSEIKTNNTEDSLERVSIIIDDVGCGNMAGLCRFRKGDTGELLRNDSTKYDYMVRIDRTSQVIYFQKEELEFEEK